MDLLDTLLMEANEINRSNKLDDFQDQLELYLNSYIDSDVYEKDLELLMHKLRADFPIDILKKKGAVFITENERCPIKELCVKDSDLFRLHGRLILAVRSPMGKILGLIGWDPTTSPKYMDSVNVGYKAKASSFFNMEIIPRIIDNKKPIFIVEGTFCCLWLEHLGFNVFCLLGSKLSKTTVRILQMLDPSRFIFILDDDDAGNNASEKFRKDFKTSLFLAVSEYNDIDDARRVIDLLPDLTKIADGNLDVEHFHIL